MTQRLDETGLPEAPTQQNFETNVQSDRSRGISFVLHWSKTSFMGQIHFKMDELENIIGN
jgi:hypothetical protein